MKKLFLALVMALVIGCSSGGMNTQMVAPAPESAPGCEVQVLQTELFKVPSGDIIGISWLDGDCDGKCDVAGVLQFIGEENGQPVFVPVGMIECSEADEILLRAKKSKGA